MSDYDFPGFYQYNKTKEEYILQKSMNDEIDRELIKRYSEGEIIPVKSELELLLEQIKCGYNSQEELKTIRATLIVNFGSSRPGNKLDIGLKNEGSTLAMLMQVLEHFCKD